MTTEQKQLLEATAKAILDELGDPAATPADYENVARAALAVAIKVCAGHLEVCAGHLERRADAMENNSRGGLGSMFANQSASDLRPSARAQEGGENA